MIIKANENLKINARAYLPYCSDGCCIVEENFQYELNKDETLELGQEYLNRSEHVFSEWDVDDFEIVTYVNISDIKSLLEEGKLELV